MQALTERQKVLIVNNVVKAVNNIDQLNKTGYNFLHLCSGFIAHYNLGGFISNYSDGSLRRDILSYAGLNQWRNFRPGERDYDYYMAKKDVYNRIIAEISQ
jgi:enhancing lycopene biosynthesis protein 2